jgi:hypothetical protein
VSASAVERLRELVTAHRDEPATSMYGWDTARADALSHGDLRALLSHVYELAQRAETAERSLRILQTPSDHERRQFIRAYVAASAGNPDPEQLPLTILDAKKAWELLLKEGA